MKKTDFIISCLALTLIASTILYHSATKNYRKTIKNYRKTIDLLLEETKFYRKYRAEELEKRKRRNAFLKNDIYYTQIAYGLKGLTDLLTPIYEKLKNGELQEVAVQEIDPSGIYFNTPGEPKESEDIELYIIYYR